MRTAAGRTLLLLVGAALVRGGAMTVGRDATMVALAFALRP